MPKRKSPFESNCPLQLKTHISQRVVNEGVARQANMQIVYERTKALLFSGARSLILNGVAQAVSNGELNSEAGRNSLDCPALTRGQLHLGAHGELLRSPQKMLQRGALKPPCTKCVLCVKQNLSGVHCHHCERSVCPSCQRQCGLCGNLFCFQCCSVNYESRDETMICSECTDH
ncbi:apoptosis regulatory protein Siva-like [Protopterus annectens]|uniref:apoptosis regulatory protein Siva-like n=1 Tax=Protopterus annectens TaxID=7888 RepID=UPI001CF9EBA3|nr:apoptosis regulatory protein Siva-like [Protopterus annectens]